MLEANSMIAVFRIHEKDNVVIAVRSLGAGQQVEAAGHTLVVAQDVPLGAKLALRLIARGEKILKYGEPIGSATESIKPGEYIHTHNLKSDYIPTPTDTLLASRYHEVGRHLEGTKL